MKLSLSFLSSAYNLYFSSLKRSVLFIKEDLMKVCCGEFKRTLVFGGREELSTSFYIVLFLLPKHKLLHENPSSRAALRQSNHLPATFFRVEL